MLRKLTTLGLLAFLSLAAAALNAKDVDLTTKKGFLLYKASYKNIAAQRTNAFSGSRVEKKDWMNIFTIDSVTFPPDTLKPGFLAAGQTILDETYSVTALDPSSKAQIGSLVFGASYAAAASGAITEAAKVVYPVLGATGVFKRAKSVLIEYKTDADRTREVSIFKTLL